MGEDPGHLHAGGLGALGMLGLAGCVWAAPRPLGSPPRLSAALSTCHCAALVLPTGHEQGLYPELREDSGPAAGVGMGAEPQARRDAQVRGRPPGALAGGRAAGPAAASAEPPPSCCACLPTCLLALPSWPPCFPACANRGVAAFELHCASEKVDLPFETISQLYEASAGAGLFAGRRGACRASAVLRLGCSPQALLPLAALGTPPAGARQPGHHRRPAPAHEGARLHPPGAPRCGAAAALLPPQPQPPSGALLPSRWGWCASSAHKCLVCCLPPNKPGHGRGVCQGVGALHRRGAEAEQPVLQHG